MWSLAACCILLAPAPAIAPADPPPAEARIEALVNDLAGRDDAARSLARQLLPRHGVAAAPRILPLLGRDDQAVAQAAYQVLADIANDAAAPGREADRPAVARLLMGLVAADRPTAVRGMGLRLLPIVVPDEFDVAPVAALLDDPALREKARVALAEMGTPPARSALRDRLGRSDPAFTIALLNALGPLADAPSRATIRDLTKHEYPGVRAAAARALAPLGDASDLSQLRGMVDRSDAATRPDALDGLLRLAVRLEGDPAARAQVVALYRDLLGGPDNAARIAALAGLGRVGDAACVAEIAGFVGGARPEMARLGVAALGAIPGDEATEALIRVIPMLPAESRPRLIPALGARRSAATLPALEAFAQSDDPAVRHDALDAIAASGRPEALTILNAPAALGTEANDRKRAVGRLLNLAATLEVEKTSDPAGQTYLAALKAIGPKPGLQSYLALEGLERNPTLDAAPTLREVAVEPVLHEPVVRAMLSVAARLHAAGRDPEAVALYRAARGLNPRGDSFQRLIEGLGAAGAADDVRGLLGVITRWSVIGPFELGANNEGWSTPFVDEPKVSVAGRYMVGKRRVAWTPVVSRDPRGRVDLLATVGRREQAIAYAYAEVIVDRPTDAMLLVGSDDGVRVWVNGKTVFETFRSRGLTPDEDHIPVSLVAGKNTILMKIHQNVLGWEFCARLVGLDGRAPAFTQPAE